MDFNPMQCKICDNLLTNPYCIICGHSFCYNCLSSIIDSGCTTCPICEKTFDSDYCVPNNNVRSLVEKFKMSQKLK